MACSAAIAGEVAGSRIVTIRTATANCYLVLGPRPYLVDTNTPKAKTRIMRALDAGGLKVEDLEYIIITHHHYDHTGCLAELKRLSGARVASGAGDAPVITGDQEPPGPGDISPAGRLLRRLPASWLQSYQRFERCAVDLELVDGQEIEELGLEVLELPGHTEGGIALYSRSERLAFIGDMVSNIMGRLGPPFLSFSYDKAAILASMRRLASLDLDYAYPGHGAVIGPDAGSRIGELADKLARRW
ncbi:MAG: MBL fold metallo-hydrolase [Actinobacteria bacterium]|nr:MBL fold metallo-hydrolase [Actinomycetota bacterium]MDI6831930.1 MBL fold metallo-hydrolase [Actinomycetota bacterium]